MAISHPFFTAGSWACRKLINRILLFFILINANILYAQQQPNLKIHVVVDNAQAIENVQVLISYANSKTVGRTDSAGLFVAQISPIEGIDTCRVSVHAFMYQPKDTLVFLSRNTELKIKLDNLQLQELEVKGYKRIITTSANKMVFNIDRRGFSTNAKADMALARLPGVVRNEDAFTLPGNNTPANIRIDDRNVDIKELRMLDLKDVDKIEVIRMGTDEVSQGGVINIIKKKHLPTQLKGEVSLSAANFSQERYSTFPYLILRTKKMEISTFFSGHISNQNSWQTIAWDKALTYNSDRSAKVGQYTASAKLSLFPSPQFKVSLSYMRFGFKSEIASDTHSDTNFSGKQHIQEAYGNHSVNVVTLYQISKNNTLNMKARFRNYKSTNKNDLPRRLEYETGMNEFTGELSLQKTKLQLIGANNDLQIGYKYIYRQHMLNAATHNFYTQVSNLFVTEEFAIGGPFDAYVALRSEWTANRMEGRTHQYHTLLPTLTLNANLRGGSLSATYTRKINRPSVDYLNPEIYYVNEHEMFQGNISLAPQYTQEVSIHYNKQMYNSNLNVFTTYSHTNNMVEMVFSDSHDRSTYENAAQADIYKMGAGLYLPMLSHKLNLNFNVSINREHYHLYERFVEKTLMENTQQRRWTVNSSLNLSYSAPKGWYFNLNGYYLNNSINLNSTTVLYPLCSFLVQKSLLKNRLELSLNYQDMFGWNQRRTTTYNFKTGMRTITTKLSSSFISLTALFRFGKNFQTRRVGTNINNDDITTK